MEKYISKYWVSLLNFKIDISNQEKITLDEDVLIRLTTSYEDERLADLYKKYFPRSSYSNYLLQVILRKDTPEVEPGQFFAEAREKIEKAITIFRLFKEERIGYTLIIQPLAEVQNYGYTAEFLWHQMLWTSKKIPEIYTLERSEIQSFTTFFKDFYKISFSEFNLAIEYFNKSYIEPYTPRDSFLDLMIALENLFLKETHQELSYKLSMRMAYILGVDKKDRINIFNFMKDAYNLRSKILHGEKSDKLNNKKFLELRKLTRKSIIYFLKNKEHWNSAKLDNLILEAKEN
ncbi:hypothetical protein CVT91_06630 [Candidatus Atribacteria bacterium HGW-Atribacteria-1]|nr:MAG: hypothetical protein CVT91_06630 [Candidatus Atribacteria bacterium HGW-Atribacteria-1]